MSLIFLDKLTQNIKSHILNKDPNRLLAYESEVLKLFPIPLSS